MRLRPKAILLILLAVPAVSMGAATPALASSPFEFYHKLCEKASTSSSHQWATQADCESTTQPRPTGGFWTQEVIPTPQPVVGGGSVPEFVTTIAKTKITIHCAKDTFEGSIEKEGKSKAGISYGECELKGIAGCGVPAFTAKVLGGLVESGGAIAEEFFEEPEAGQFVTVVITGCVAKGSYKVTGTQICKLPGGEEYVVEHEVVCATSGSKLKVGSETATYEGMDTVKSEKEAWAVEPTV